MKKVVFFAICVVGLLSFTSCGSTAPCGLSQKSNQVDFHKAEVIIAYADVE